MVVLYSLIQAPQPAAVVMLNKMMVKNVLFLDSAVNIYASCDNVWTKTIGDLRHRKKNKAFSGSAGHQLK